MIGNSIKCVRDNINRYIVVPAHVPRTEREEDSQDN